MQTYGRDATESGLWAVDVTIVEGVEETVLKLDDWAELMTAKLLLLLFIPAVVRMMWSHWVHPAGQLLEVVMGEVDEEVTAA